MLGPQYLIGVFTKDGDRLAVFQGQGPVERALVSAISARVRQQLGPIVDRVLAPGAWWVRPAKFRAAVAEAVAESVPSAVEAAIDALLIEMKQEASMKHFVG